MYPVSDRTGNTALRSHRTGTQGHACLGGTRKGSRTPLISGPDATWFQMNLDGSRLQLRPIASSA